MVAFRNILAAGLLLAPALALTATEIITGLTTIRDSIRDAAEDAADIDPIWGAVNGQIAVSIPRILKQS